MVFMWIVSDVSQSNHGMSGVLCRVFYRMYRVFGMCLSGIVMERWTHRADRCNTLTDMHISRLVSVAFMLCLHWVWTGTVAALYGKSYFRAAKDTWRLFKDRGIDALVNDQLVGMSGYFFSFSDSASSDRICCSTYVGCVLCGDVVFTTFVYIPPM